MIPATVNCAVHGFLVRNSAVDDTGVGLPQMELFEISSKFCDSGTQFNSTWFTAENYGVFGPFSVLAAYRLSRPS